MTMKAWIFLCLVNYALGAIVQTKLGALKGWEGKSRNGRIYHAYTKVPYAKPPIGKLRLENPVAIDAWEGELDATQDSPHCLQPNMMATEIIQKSFLGQEDCLNLNIYSPNGIKNAPVLIHIHGGAFKMGHPGPRDMADYIMDEDVILVTVHYRLGGLGFLSLEDKIISGNYGLKDQALAIKWVHENIDAFGGNPDKITLFGESAGGASAHFHMYSPLSKDLIKGVISESGVVNKAWSLAPKGQMEERTLKIARSLNCVSDCPKEILNCLQKADPTEILSGEKLFTYWNDDDMIPIKPVVEINIAGAFLTADPFTIKSTIPWITGFAVGEGLLKSIPLHLKPKAIMEDFLKRVDEITARQMVLDPTGVKTQEIVDKVKNRYYQTTDLTELIEAHGKFFRDFFFVYPALKSLEKHKGPKFMYYLEHRGEGTLFDIFIKANTSEPGHVDEIFHLFNLKTRYNLKGTPEDEKISKSLVKLWTNFAKYQTPSPPGSEIEWPQYDKKTRKFLRIVEGFPIGQNGWEDTFTFWDNINKISKTKKEEL